MTSRIAFHGTALIGIAPSVADIAETQPDHAADLLEAMKPLLSNADERKRLEEDMEQSLAGGTFDPMPPCGAIGGVIAPPRGDHAGAANSAVSVIPHAGDLAKAGRLKRVDRRRKRSC